MSKGTGHEASKVIPAGPKKFLHIHKANLLANRDVTADDEAGLWIEGFDNVWVVRVDYGVDDEVYTASIVLIQGPSWTNYQQAPGYNLPHVNTAVAWLETTAEVVLGDWKHFEETE